MADLGFRIATTKIDISLANSGGTELIARVTFEISNMKDNNLSVYVRCKPEEENEIIRLAWKELHRVSSYVAEAARVRGG